MDRNGYYGGESASLTPLDDVSEEREERAEGEVVADCIGWREEREREGKWSQTPLDERRKEREKKGNLSQTPLDEEREGLCTV